MVSLSVYQQYMSPSSLEAADVDASAAKAELARVRAPEYLAELRGTLGADPFHLQNTAYAVL